MTTSENATPLPITEAQRGIWVAQQIDPLSPRYNCGGYLEIAGEPCFETLSRAIDAALAECEALRVNFASDDSNPGQTICPVAPNSLEFVDLRKSDDAEHLALSIMSEDLSIARNLLAAGLIRQMLFVLPDSRCFYYLRYHHILMDGYGQIVYWRRVAELYSAFSTGAEPLPAPARALAAILEADAAYMASAAREDDRRAWADKLRDLPPPVDLGGRANGLARARLRRSVALPSPLVDKLHARASRSRSRWSPIMLAAVAAYVRTLVSGDDVVLSLPVPARVGAAALGTPAMLANELPLRLQVGLEQTFDELVAHVTSSVGFVLEHQRYRGEALQRELASSARSGRIGAPVVNLITFDRPVTFGTCPASPHYLSSGPVDDLLVGCYGRMDGVNIDLVFDANPERYSPEDVARHQTRFLHVLDALLSADTGAPLGAIDLLLPAERARIDRWNATQRPFDLTGSLHRLIEGQARRIPDAVAAVNGTSQLTYRQLDEQASRLAAHLLALGVAPGDRVGVAEYRSLEMPVALLAILKAGAAYVPLDPDQPADRTAFQIDDAAVRVVLTRSTLRERFAALDVPTLVCVDAVLPGLPAPVAALPEVGPDAAAYVIYTSGSTGRPKGVAVPHRGVVNRLLWMQEQYRLTADDCVLQKTPYTFDVSVWEFFWPLIAGSRIVFAEPGAHRDPRRIAALIDAHRVTTIHFVPPMLDLFLEELNAGEAGSLRRVICSGEALRAETVGAFFRAFPPASGVELHNLYGPTEASIDVSHWRCGPGDADGLVPIGAPVANTQLHVLDTAGRPVPVGSTGELFIGGVQVALGYLNRPELNARCFVDDPFRAGGTLYRTGDLARWRSDGAIEFLGRIDQQVKIRGFRVEPGEIESALLAHPDVRQAVVGTWRVRDGETRLIAHVVMRDDTPLAHGEMVAHLGARLPEYMIPQHLMTLRALPLSRNGKIDRGALPMPDSDAPLPPSGAAHFDTAAERLLAEVWRELLGAAVQDAEPSFFSLGGDSMLAIRMRSRVERAGMTFDIQDVFQYPTLRALATRLRPHGGAVAPARLAPFALLAQADRARLPTGVVDAYPVAAMQGGMLFHAELDAQSSVYRVVTSLRMAARFDIALLRRAIDATVARHPLLRTGFDLSSFSEPMQLVYGGAGAPIAVADATDDSAAAFEARVNDWVADAKHHCFDVSKPPLMTFAVHLRDAGCFQLSVIEHHAILDGWSDAAMLQEIVDRYAAALDGQELWLPALPSAYVDFVAEERRVSADPAASEYWRSRLVEAEHAGLPRRALPCAAPGGSRHRGFEVPLAVDSLAGLQGLARQAGLPLKSLLTAVHVAVLGLVAGWARVSTGLVVNGRLEHEGGDAVLGVFLNTLPLSIDASGLSFVAIARAAFEFERDSAPYRRYPFGAIQQVAGGLELDSYVNFIDFHAMWRQRGADGALIRDAVGVAETNYPLAANFLVDPIGGQLRAWLDCDVTQLDEAFCEQMAGYYARGVAALLATPEARVDEVELIGPDEVAQLASWNDTQLDYDVEATIHGAFEQHAAAHPEAIALVHRDREIGYGELDARANRLARHLAAEGLAPGLLVGISLPRGIDMVVAMLAVMKSGCAYVPLDPDYPHDRLRFISEDAGLACLIADSTSSLVGLVPSAVLMDRDDALLSAARSTSLACPVGSDAAAYVIYTSGSTGRPKGTRITHRNVANFFAGMDAGIGCGRDDVVLSVTSMSFDISVLELLWPLTRGARVVIAGERIVRNLVADHDAPARELGLSLFFFAAAADDARRGDGYRLVMEAARLADALDFEAIWTPERHFHEFGGLYPNPSVMSAALASVTRRVGLRCGSVVAPLHDVIRVAEEWSLVDNLSHGRVGLAFASGWNANDFALAPHVYPNRKQHMSEQLDEFLRLWRGESVERINGAGEPVALRIFPKPVQAQPPVWLTSAGMIDTFERAGASGANLLTHLLGQDVDELARKIAAYRAARARAGHAGAGRVTVMVHTYLDDDEETARAAARGPFREYLRTSTELWRQLFSSMGIDYSDSISREDLDSVLELAVDRYFDRSGLFGAPESVMPTLRALSAAGADELACLVDFGVPTDDALRGVRTIGRLKRLYEAEVADAAHAFDALCTRHGVTVVQGTPSLMAAICDQPAALTALRGARALLVGGEAFPAGVADRLLTALPTTRVFNMYGPTETTIWSAVHELERVAHRRGHLVPIGRPIANTEIRVVDARLRPTPIGVAGELLIGGDGVSGVYLGRPDLSAERFPAHPSGRGRIYRTGDRARWRPDGLLEFLGRVDRQVKILGHRIEPDEVESVLSRHAQVANVAVVSREGAGGRIELVAYVAPSALIVDTHAEEAHVARWGQVWEDAYADPDHGVSEMTDREFAGWKSSYTGAPIPIEQMRDWLARTVVSVLRLAPRRVVDVGVGVGLLLRNVVTAVDRYLGVDVSETALDAARACLAHVPHDGVDVELRRGEATLLAELEPGAADTVVINSVIQYFPSATYLERVLAEAVRVVGARGAVFVGDVRDLGLIEAFHASVQLERAAPLTTAGELRAIVARKLAEETELCLSPRYFVALAARLGTVGRVQIEIKRGHAANELTCFRYDVTLLGARRDTAEPERVSIDWPALATTDDGLADSCLQALASRLERCRAEPLTVTAIPNRRLVKPLAQRRLLHEAAHDTTAWSLEREVWLVDDTHAVDPEAIAGLADRLGLEVRLLVGADGRLDHFDAHFSLPRDHTINLGEAAAGPAFEITGQPS